MLLLPKWVVITILHTWALVFVLPDIAPPPPPPLEPAHHFHILWILGQLIYMQKLFLALVGEGGNIL